jgi:hypothetical protein
VVGRRADGWRADVQMGGAGMWRYAEIAQTGSVQMGSGDAEMRRNAQTGSEVTGNGGDAQRCADRQ